MSQDRYSDISYGTALTDGTPCWLEIATPNAVRTMEFYSHVLGWDYESRLDTNGAQYVVATLFGDPVAGLVGSTRVVQDWTIYLSTSDLKWSEAESARYGGAAVSGTHVVPGIGSKVLGTGASGAFVGLCQPAGDWAFGTGVPGTLVWVELVTSQATLADRFFGRLFGFDQVQFGNGREIDYVVWYAGSDSVIGRVRIQRSSRVHPRPRWIAHFMVDADFGFEETLQIARRHGATMRLKPYDTTLGKVAVLADPLGTRFALIDPTQAAPWQYGSGADDPYDD